MFRENLTTIIWGLSMVGFFGPEFEREVDETILIHEF